MYSCNYCIQIPQMIRKMLNNIQLIITIFQKEFKIKTNKHIWNMADDFEY